VHVRAVPVVHVPLVSQPEGRAPPGDVVVAGDADHLAHPLRVADEGTRAQELASARPLRHVTTDGDHIEALALDDLLNRVDLLRDGRLPEVEIGDVEDAHRWRTLRDAIRAGR